MSLEGMNALFQVGPCDHWEGWLFCEVDMQGLHWRALHVNVMAEEGLGYGFLVGVWLLAITD